MRGFILMLCLLVAAPVAHSRSLMDDVFAKPSQYTRDKQRLRKARVDHKIQMMRHREERARIRTNALRRQDYIKNQQHLQRVLDSQRRGTNKLY